MPKPPTTRKPPQASDHRHSLPAQLREIISSRNLSAYAVAKAAGIDPGVMSRFMTGARDIRFETAARVAEALGLRLVEVGKGKSRARPTPRAVGAQAQGPGTQVDGQGAGAA